MSVDSTAGPPGRPSQGVPQVGAFHYRRLALPAVLIAAFVAWNMTRETRGRELATVGVEEASATPEEKARTRGCTTMLVRVRVHVVDQHDRPMAAARVVLAPSMAVLDSEEAVDQVREAIRRRIDLGERAWKCAMGTTDAGGVVELEFTRLIDSDEPLFTTREGSSASRFPFSSLVRIDATPSGTFFGELLDPKNVRYRRVPNPTVLEMGEADFVVRCVPGARPVVDSDQHATSEATGLNVERKARDAAAGR